MKKIILLIAIALVGLLVLAGCQVTTEENAMMDSNNSMTKQDPSMKNQVMDNNDMINIDDNNNPDNNHNEGTNSMMEKTEKTESGENGNNEMMEKSINSNQIASADHTPTHLAGTTTQYHEFTHEAYKQAKEENKVILLFFYASWCQECREEQTALHNAFNQLNEPNVIGFRVNYKDSDTQAAEVDLAREFGITYQHTKVILKNGERVQKSGESWDKERYVSELTTAAQ